MTRREKRRDALPPIRPREALSTTLPTFKRSARLERTRQWSARKNREGKRNARLAAMYPRMAYQVGLPRKRARARWDLANEGTGGGNGGRRAGA